MASKIESGLEVNQTPETALPEHHVPEEQQKIYAGYQGQSGNSPLAGRKFDGGAGNEWQDDPARNRESPRPQRILGMSPFLFGLTVALVTAAIVGGAVGGGIGNQYESAMHRLDYW